MTEKVFDTNADDRQGYLREYMDTRRHSNIENYDYDYDYENIRL